MSFVVYWLEPDESRAAKSRPFDSTEMSKAMSFMEVLRKSGAEHVVMSSQPDEMVGGFGVDSVEDGKTPDGQPYDWSKADRAGKTRRR